MVKLRFIYMSQRLIKTASFKFLSYKYVLRRQLGYIYGQLIELFALVKVSMFKHANIRLLQTFWWIHFRGYVIAWASFGINGTFHLKMGTFCPKMDIFWLGVLACVCFVLHLRIYL